MNSVQTNGIIDTLERKYGPSRLVELGKIKIGGLSQARQSRSGGTFRLPRKDDHFTITTLSRNQNGDLIPDDALMNDLLQAGYGDQDNRLRRIPIRLLSDEIDDCIQAAFVWYGRKACGARSDGVTVTWFYDPVDFSPYHPPKVEPWSADMIDRTVKIGGAEVPMFKLHANFSCVIAALQARWGGVYKFRTTSVISYRQLRSSLLHVHQLTGGILMGMPLELVVRPITVAPNGKTTIVYVVHVELLGMELAAIQDMAIQQAKYRLEFHSRIKAVQTEYRKLLVAPGYESPEDMADIAMEFADIPAPEIPTIPTSAAERVRATLEAKKQEAAARGQTLDVSDSQIEPEADEQPPISEDFSQTAEAEADELHNGTNGNDAGPSVEDYLHYIAASEQESELQEYSKIAKESKLSAADKRVIQRAVNDRLAVLRSRQEE